MGFKMPAQRSSLTVNTRKKEFLKSHLKILNRHYSAGACTQSVSIATWDHAPTRRLGLLALHWIQLKQAQDPLHEPEMIPSKKTEEKASPATFAPFVKTPSKTSSAPSANQASPSPSNIKPAPSPSKRATQPTGRIIYKKKRSPSHRTLTISAMSSKPPWTR